MKDIVFEYINSEMRLLENKNSISSLKNSKIVKKNIWEEL